MGRRVPPTLPPSAAVPPPEGEGEARGLDWLTPEVLGEAAGARAAHAGQRPPDRLLGGGDWRTWVFLALSGLGTGASWLCYFHALKVGEAARVQPIDKLSVVLVALLGVLFLGEKLSPLSWAGVALVTAGAVLIALG